MSKNSRAPPCPGAQTGSIEFNLTAPFAERQERAGIGSRRKMLTFRMLQAEIVASTPG
jgi:hypothetical protein